VQLPSALINSLQNVTGFNQLSFEKVHQSGEQVTSVRLNPNKKNDGLVFDTDGNVPWSSNGWYLKERPSFTIDPLFHAGAYYVQEASSMFVEQALRQTVDLSVPIKILDLCAAPGGKSTLIQSLITADSLLVSNEVIKTRAGILTENITKWGAANTIVTNNDPKDFQRLENYFDVMVVDAPCSGSGLFRKDPMAIEEWSKNNVELCSQRQQRIIADILPALKPGGVLIYSTCSYSTDEDEAIADWLINDCQLSSVHLQLNADWNIVETISPLHQAYGYRFYPDQLRGEGFFIAVFRKPAAAATEHNDKIPKSRSEKLPAKEIDILRPYLQNRDAFFYIKQKEEILAVPLYLQQELAIIQSALYIKKAGIKLGTIIREELIPDHELALSTLMNQQIPAVELELADALQYLRKQEIKIDAAKKGWALVTYRHLPMGWVKILPNRVNNYYPKEWRIVNK
jgi:16S rRNA C967 or C1407 C5-methylase (RsmB/RsmF family)/NOL1/NOP2/fmu family ribosome biogenesis protein